MSAPAYAYVPGRTQRHPEGAFDAIRATAEPEPLASEALRTGLDWIDAGYFWKPTRCSNRSGWRCLMARPEPACRP